MFVTGIIRIFRSNCPRGVQNKISLEAAILCSNSEVHFSEIVCERNCLEKWWWRKTPVEMWWWWRKTIEMWRWCGGSGGGKQLKCGGGLVMVVEENNGNVVVVVVEENYRILRPSNLYK